MAKKATYIQAKVSGGSTVESFEIVDKGARDDVSSLAGRVAALEAQPEPDSITAAMDSQTGVVTVSKNGSNLFSTLSSEKSIQTHTTFENRITTLELAAVSDENVRKIVDTINGIDNRDITSEFFDVSGSEKVDNTIGVLQRTIGENSDKLKLVTPGGINRFRGVFIDATQYDTVTVTYKESNSNGNINTASVIKYVFCVVGYKSADSASAKDGEIDYDDENVKILVKSSSATANSNAVFNKADFPGYERYELYAQIYRWTTNMDFSWDDVEDISDYIEIHVSIATKFVYKSDYIPTKKKADVDNNRVNGVEAELSTLLVPYTVGTSNNYVLKYTKATGVFTISAGSSSNKRKLYSVGGIEKYDYLTISRCSNNLSVSTSVVDLCSIALFADGDYETGTCIFRSHNQSAIIDLIDYRGRYETLMLYVGCDYSQTDLPLVECSCKSLSEDFLKKKRRQLVIVGDSLCGNDSALLKKELNSICASFNWHYPVARTTGGEAARGNLARCGGLPLRLTANMVMPASGGVVCNFASGWINSSGEYTAQPLVRLGLRANICDVTGVLSTAPSDVAKVAFYNSSDELISTETTDGTYTAPTGVSYMKFCINVQPSGVPHLTINSDEVGIVPSSMTQGYIDSSTGVVTANSAFLVSESVSVSEGDTVYCDALAESGSYIFTRDTAGSSFTCAEGTTFYLSAREEDANLVHVVFTGQNEGYEDADDFANMIESAMKAFDGRYIVCTVKRGSGGDTTTQAFRRTMLSRFGSRYIDFSTYTATQAVYDGIRFGLITDTTKTAADAESIFYPGSDKVHQNNLLSYLWAVQIWNRLVDLGYIDCTKVTDGTAYVS